MAYRGGNGLIRPDLMAEKMEQIHFTLLNFGYWQQDDTPDLKNDILSNYKLVCITQGTCVVSVGKKQYFMNTGDSIIIAPFVLYTATCTGDIRVEFFDFHFNVSNVEAQARFLELFGVQLAAFFPASLPAQAIPMLHLSFQNMMAGKPGCSYSSKLSFLRTMLNLLTTSPGYVHIDARPHHALGKERMVEECVKYLKAHESGNVTVEDLCHAVHVSQSYLYQSFLTVTGQSTKEFIITYKLKLVELELKHSSRSIQSLSETFGFSSVYALSSQFKRYYGVSPLKYRKRYFS